MNDAPKMDRYWIISAGAGAPDLTQEAWVQLIESDQRLTIGAPIRAPNPFRPGEEMVVNSNPLSAIVVVDGDAVGVVGWAEDGSAAIVASCRTQENHTRMRLLVTELARQLCCRVEEGVE